MRGAFTGLLALSLFSAGCVPFGMDLNGSATDSNLSEAAAKGGVKGKPNATAAPTLAPTTAPTVAPTPAPTLVPTTTPTAAPTSTPVATPVPGPISSALTFEPTTIAMGTVYLGQTRVYPVVVKNTSSNATTIASVEVVGSGVAVQRLTLPKTVAAGASTWFAVSFIPTASGNVPGAIYFKNSSGSIIAGLTVTGNGVALDATNSVSVTTYGARGDGATDDRGAFQSAANAAGATKVLFVPRPPGGQHYKLTGFVRVYGSVVGQAGGAKPEIRMYGANGQDAPGTAPPQSILYYKGNTAGTVITGLHLNGGRYFAPGTNVYGYAGMEYSHALILQGVSNVNIENNLIENTQGDNIILGGEDGTAPIQNAKVINNTLRHAMRISIFPVDTRGMRAYLNTITEVVSYQGALDFEPDAPPRADWDSDVAYNDFTTTLLYDHLILLSNIATSNPAPGGYIKFHHNWAQPGPKPAYLNLFNAATGDAWVGNSIETSVPAYPPQ